MLFVRCFRVFDVRVRSNDMFIMINIAYGGLDCEQDIMKECETAGCHNTSKCMEKINGFECMCSSSSGYTGDLCVYLCLFFTKCIMV